MNASALHRRPICDDDPQTPLELGPRNALGSVEVSNRRRVRRELDEGPGAAISVQGVSHVSGGELALHELPSMLEVLPEGVRRVKVPKKREKRRDLDFDPPVVHRIGTEIGVYKVDFFSMTDGRLGLTIEAPNGLWWDVYVDQEKGEVKAF